LLKTGPWKAATGKSGRRRGVVVGEACLLPGGYNSFRASKAAGGQNVQLSWRPSIGVGNRD